MRRFVDNSGLLVVGTLTALVWANVDLEGYRRATHAVHFAVNDVWMAFFFALAAKEVVEATAPGGPLNAPRRAAVPLVAAVGGMIGPAAIYAGRHPGSKDQSARHAIADVEPAEEWFAGFRS